MILRKMISVAVFILTALTNKILLSDSLNKDSSFQYKPINTQLKNKRYEC